MATSKQKMENRKGGMKTPPVVSPQEWQVARQQLLVKEKALTRSRDALAAERRRMPWMAVEKKYEFDKPFSFTRRCWRAASHSCCDTIFGLAAVLVEVLTGSFIGTAPFPAVESAFISVLLLARQLHSQRRQPAGRNCTGYDQSDRRQAERAHHITSSSGGEA